MLTPHPGEKLGRVSRAREAVGSRVAERPGLSRPAARPVPRPGASVLDLQRTCGNAAVARLLSPRIQRTPVGWEPGEKGPFEDTHLKQKVTVEEERQGKPGVMNWLVLKDEKGTSWLYIPAGDVRPDELYVKFSESVYKTQQSALRKKSEIGAPQKSKEQQLKESEELEKQEDVRVLTAFKAGTWGAGVPSVTERFLANRPKARRIYDDLILGVEWMSIPLAPPHDTIASRVERTFVGLAKALATKGGLEETPDLQKKLNQVVDPLRPDAKRKAAQLSSSQLDEVSQALAELDYAAIVVGSSKLKEPFVLGAQSRHKDPGQVVPVVKEAEHGSLPPLHVMNLEVDAYYRTADGILHADEVKNTPRALGAKLKDGGQLTRQLQWLDLPVNDPDGSLVKKRVGYFVQATGPKFDVLLSEAMVNGFQALDERQPGEAFIRIGAERLTYVQLRDMYDRAVEWIEASRAVLAADPETKGTKEGNYDSKKVFPKYFDTLEKTRETLGAGPLTAKAEKPTTEKVRV